MNGSAPIQLHRLLGSLDAENREAAWEQLIGDHTRLLIAVARSFGGDHDDAMERYSYILEKLREGDFRRLRSFDAGAGATFSTWLTVASRRLCLDHHRAHFGRARNEHTSDKRATLRAVRRALKDLTEGEIPPDSIVDSTATSTDSIAIRGELDRVLQSELDRLTPRQRLLLTLRFEDDLSASRIASILGLRTPFHVYRQLNAMLGNLRHALQQRGFEGSDG